MKSPKFDLPKYRLFLLLTLLVMSGCILTEDSPSKRGVADTGTDAGPQPDILADATADARDDADSGGLECDWEQLSVPCLLDALYGRTFATLMTVNEGQDLPSLDFPAVGVGAWVEFHEPVEGDPTCSITVEFGGANTGTCTITADNSVLLISANNRTILELQPVVSEEGVVHLKTEPIPNIGVLTLKPLPEAGTRETLKEQLKGGWVEVGAPDPGSDESILVGAKFNISDSSSYGLVGNGAYQPWIKGTLGIIACEDAYCWILYEATYTKDEPNCTTNDCFSAGEGSAPLGGMISQGGVDDGIALPRFEDDSMSGVAAERRE